MEPTRIVLLTFGPADTTHYQAAHALLSTLARRAGRQCEAVVVTDQPQRYRWFADLVRLVAIDADQLRRWQGAHAFFWRVKIEALRLVASQGPGHVVYLDSDVQCRADLGGLLARLDAGSACMHQPEVAIAAMRRRGNRPFRDALLSGSWRSFALGPGAQMWNAGVIGIPGQRLALIDSALAICDELLAAGIGHTLVEQFAFSAALAAADLQPAQPWFDHYWGNKPAFHAAIAGRLAGHCLAATSAAAVIAGGVPPIELPVSVRRRWWNRWCARFA
jgi:hypothetical protein